MQLVADITIPNAKKELTLDAEDIKRLKKLRVINPMTYFYFALLCSYGQASPSIDKDNFCDEWGLEPDDFDLLLAQLQKKGALTRKPERYVQLSLFSPAEQGDES
ncbi:hypothetical protein BZZ01_05095 [Nostocales cyanobacterium HT-58-2]|nr:hypothetical protein BZZ01_05095 [Nostocales cyanobacterium HT-58-2]